ncbi:DUF5381 family protein [Bacillus carboniphilus]|uniref:DUF5381 family protein n=1 Tax=Bacillus carboniphilus TaxID=86663 RepID=A0ABY9JUW6_9BACI|nr:DUF5381 family protein [Bacillus carboniphilus]WLR41450.1 DUF5381 family protein [Bacillus carboniphilus]
MINKKEDKKNNLVHIKGSKFYYVNVFLFTVGFSIGMLLVIRHGLKFESNLSLLWVTGGVILFPFFLYLTLWCLPGLIPGRVLFSIKPEEMIIYKNKKVLMNTIRNVDLIRNNFNLINYIIIETFEGKRIRIPTYNILPDIVYLLIIDQYVYPYMTDQSKQVWDRKVDLDYMLKVARYTREEQKIN